MLLTALLTLRRVAIHHHALLAGSLQDVSALMAECIGGSSAQVSQAAIMCLLDLFISLGAPMLRHCENQLVPHQSCLLALLLAASLGRTPEIRHWAEQALRWVGAESGCMAGKANVHVRASHASCKLPH